MNPFAFLDSYIAKLESCYFEPWRWSTDAERDKERQYWKDRVEAQLKYIESRGLTRRLARAE